MKRLIPIAAFSVLLIAAGGGLPPLVDAAKNSDSAAIRAIVGAQSAISWVIVISESFSIPLVTLTMVASGRSARASGVNAPRA